MGQGAFSETLPWWISLSERPQQRITGRQAYTQKLFSHGSGGWRPIVKVSRGWSFWRPRGIVCSAHLSQPLAWAASLGSLGLWTRHTSLCFHLHLASPCVCLQIHPSYKDTVILD